MKFAATMKQNSDGSFTASATSEYTGTVTVSSFSKEAALTKLKDELRFNLEACPCTTGYEGNAIEVIILPE